jgi:hypothetical protein
MYTGVGVKSSGEQRVPVWYQIFFEAMQERDRFRALPQIERARRAIRDRVNELRSFPLENVNEVRDLDSAATYLCILLQHVASESGDLLWD